MVKKMSIKPTVLKLGGSVITDKKKPLTPKLLVIERLANEISRGKGSQLILIHGGGSFGHPVAERYHIAEGFRDPSQIMGFSETHRAMTELNSLVMKALISHNIPAVEVQPSSCAFTKAGRISSIELRPLKKMLRMGFVPVLYGDAILDSEKGFAILSGDQVASSLAVKLDAERIIMGLDEDGLYTADPKTDSSAHLITQITMKELKSLRHKIGGSNATDVTGGMLGKMLELKPAIECKIQALIVNATKPQRVYKALKGEKVIGTIIKKGETID